MADGSDPGALLALWNDVSPGVEAAYEDWHAVEHVPERLTVPGIDWALRFRREDGAGPARQRRFLTLYGLRDVTVLDSAPYRHLLANPTPASAGMRPHLLNVSRWVCRVTDRNGPAFQAPGPAGPGPTRGAPSAAGRTVGRPLDGIDAPAVDAPVVDALDALAVLPVDREGLAREALAVARSAGAGQWLLARRCPEAAPLPWLARSHAAPIDGDWLFVCQLPTAGTAGTAGTARLPGDAAPVRYRRLPVGRGS